MISRSLDSDCLPNPLLLLRAMLVDAVLYQPPTAKRKQTFMLFAYPTGCRATWFRPG
jgi:hypothetical protein